VAGERLDGHVRQAVRSGVGYEVLTAMMTLVTNYVGQARGSQAMEAVQRVAGPGRRRHRQVPDRDPAKSRAVPMSATALDNEVTL
jgi:hypothetical protein